MIPFPRWLDSVPEHRRALVRQRFLLRIAALYATEHGTISDLSVALGLHRNTILCLTQRLADTISVELAIQVEEHVGREIVSREQFLPKVFRVSETTSSK